MKRRIHNSTYWVIAYFIPYNEPQICFSSFISKMGILGGKYFNANLNYKNYYICRVIPNINGKRYFPYYLCTGKTWKRLPEIEEYDRNIINPNLKYIT